MRPLGFRLFTIVLMLVLLSGSQLCTFVDCGAAAPHRALHPCCAAAAARAAKSGGAAHALPHACTRPCCIEIALPHAPQLERPVPVVAPAFLACVAPASGLAAAPRPAPLAPSPPGDEPGPAAPPPAAAGTRAPPLA